MSERKKLVEEMISICERYDLIELEYQEGDMKIKVRRKPGQKKKQKEGEYLPEGMHIIKSPFVGTFYRAPSPEASPFVQEGDVVQKGQVLCIIESMKIMNEVECDINGKVVSILVENGAPVEYGQELFIIEKS